jgi:hypothetical protein
LPSRLGFAFAPRVGYILPVNQTIGVWFKGGITYFSVKDSSTDTRLGQSTNFTDTTSGFSLNIEPELVITPVPRFGFTVGGIADIALSGSHKQEATGATAGSIDNGHKINNFGLAFGLLGYI